MSIALEKRPAGQSSGSLTLHPIHRMFSRPLWAQRVQSAAKQPLGL